MKAFFAALLVATLIPLISFAKENTTPDATAVDSACTAEAATAGCGAEKVGTGLLKCLHAYHKAHHDAKPSAGCKAAMQKMRTDHAAEHKAK